MSHHRKGISRRQFLKHSATAAAMMSLQWKRMLMAAPPVVGGPYGMVSPALTKFKDPIRTIGGDIPLAASDGVAPVTGVQHYTMDIGPYTDILHSDLQSLVPGYSGTKLWGYGQYGNHKHLGGIIVASRNNPIQITFNNNLTGNQIIPNDTTLPQPVAQRWDRTAVHLHGGHVHWISDGGPHDWWAPDGSHGPSFLNNEVLNPGAVNTNKAEYYYPNDQSARLMWYHDHAWGITRTNAYAGIASGYVLVDPTAEAAFDTANPGVPSALDLGIINSKFFYLIFQDKIFINPVTGTPLGYGADAVPGDLFYAYQYDPLLFGPAGIPSFGEPLAGAFPVPSCVPEFFGDTMLVNGTAYPTLEVEARPVRIRMLNACSSRFLTTRLVGTMGTTFPNSAEPNTAIAGPRFIQIGTEGGYLPQPVLLKEGGPNKLLMAPAERVDILIDFSAVAPGTEFILYNDAPGPYPGGAKIFDYFVGNGKTPWSIPGYGPNTRTLMKFRVMAATGAVTPLPVKINTAIANLSDPLLVIQTPGVPTPIPASVPAANRRILTLNEGFDKYGRLAQFLGPATTRDALTAPGFFGRDYMDTPTEIVTKGSVEVWQIANLTADAHPIHFHLSNVQILYRQAISLKGLGGTFTINPMGKPIAPDDNELGYKETVRMNPGEVTVVIMKFDIPPNPKNVSNIPESPRTGGAEYVWHCHILEHEEHDMMRPLVVL
jgi:spore coat protein A, manganese oxidase